ncbi:MAG: polysaccharide pyruvyl transferase family protein [Acutalibacteraceae bacterium]
MKIGIITFQLAWNCGAVLQCAALQRMLESSGYEVCVINYCPKYKDYRYKKYQNPFLVALGAYKSNKQLSLIKRSIKAIKSAGRAILNYNPKSGRIKQKKDFAQFCENFLNLTREYKSLEELKADPPKCDVYISGSDQLWNPNLTNEKLDGAYFLDFGDDTIIKASYAVSACELDVQKNKESLEDLLENLDYISLREDEKKSELETLVSKNISICIDPTLLLDAEQYADMESDKVNIEEPYLLVYALDNPGSDEPLFKTVKNLSEQRNLKIKVISGPHKWPYAIDGYQPRDGISPQEFLSYIKNADVVVTNSFHATAFSIIYRKEFYVLTTQGRGARLVELLNKIGLEKQLLCGDNAENVKCCGIDYSNALKKLEEYCTYSKKYLNQVINEEKKAK